jgi:3-oxoacyl-[acyl-carrier protein] reductase
MSEFDRPLAGRVALVSGGSRGMGAAIAQRLARSGADVVITYASDADAAAAVTERIRSHGVDGDHVRAQAADAAQVGAAVDIQLEQAAWRRTSNRHRHRKWSCAGD